VAIKQHSTPDPRGSGVHVLKAVESAVEMGCSLADINAELLRRQVLSLQVQRMDDRGVWLVHPKTRRKIIFEAQDIPKGSSFHSGQWVDLELRMKSTQDDWCFWGKTPTQAHSQVESTNLRNSIRSALEQPQGPRMALLALLRQAVSQSGDKNEEDRAFIEGCLREIESLPPQESSLDFLNDLSSFPPARDQADQLLSMKQELQGWPRLESPKEVADRLMLIEKVKAQTWSEESLQDQERVESFMAWMGETTFEGVLENIGSGYGFIRSPYFSGAVFVLRDEVVTGDLVAGAPCQFKVQIVFYDEAWKFAAREVISQGQRRVDTFPYWVLSQMDEVNQGVSKAIKARLEKGAPVLVLFNGELRQREGLQTFARHGGIPQNDMKWVSDLYPEAELPMLPSWTGALICKPKNLSWDDCRGKESRRQLVRTFYSLSAKTLAEKDQSSWTILMDETGACDDFLPNSRGRGRSSVMMAVVVPPGVNLPPCPSAYHSYESPYHESESLRQEILKQPKVKVFGWSYLMGAPLEGQSLVTSDFHAQMWRHAMDYCLEWVAQQAESRAGKEKVHVKIYLEQVGALTPQHKGLFDDRMTTLLETCQDRRGWSNLLVAPPRIVGKDVHPWMGYVDVMGSVYRPSGQWVETVASIRSLRVCPRVVAMDYRQDHMEVLSQSIMLSGRKPFTTLLLLASMEEAHLDGYGVVIRGLVKDCLRRLSDNEMVSLHENLERILSRQPECHMSAEWICGQMPKELYGNDEYKPSLRLLGLTNQLLSFNHQGNTKEAFGLIGRGASLAKEVKSNGLRLRFYCHVAEAYANALEYDGCLKILDDHTDECRDKMADVWGAMRLMSYRMQVKALLRQDEEAMSLWEELYPYLSTKSEEMRFQIYKAHMLIDRGEYSEAWSELYRYTGGKNNDQLVSWALESRFFLALILKLQVHCPRLNRKQRHALLRIEFGRGYPWVNIGWWGLQIESSKHREARKGQIIRILTEPTQSAKMEMVRYCFWSQLIADGESLGGDMNFDLRFRSSKEWLRSHPMEIKVKRGMLRPLSFYHF
jgi:hypothetical protein